jgi:hypothetical protein
MNEVLTKAVAKVLRFTVPRTLTSSRHEQGDGRAWQKCYGSDSSFAATSSADWEAKSPWAIDPAEARRSARSPELRARVVFMTGGLPRAAAFVEENADRVVDEPFDIMADLARRLSPERA